MNYREIWHELQGRSTLYACTQSFFRNPGMHQSMQSGSIARAACDTHVLGLPAELVEDGARLLLRAAVVAADEHRRPRRELRVDHESRADAVERLHELRRRRLLLQTLEERVVRTGEEREHAARRRGFGDRVRRVEHNLAREPVAALSPTACSAAVPFTARTTTSPKLAVSANVPAWPLPLFFFQSASFATSREPRMTS